MENFTMIRHISHTSMVKSKRAKKLYPGAIPALVVLCICFYLTSFIEPTEKEVNANYQSSEYTFETANPAAISGKISKEISSSYR